MGSIQWLNKSNNHCKQLSIIHFSSISVDGYDRLISSFLQDADHIYYAKYLATAQVVAEAVLFFEDRLRVFCDYVSVLSRIMKIIICILSIFFCYIDRFKTMTTSKKPSICFSLILRWVSINTVPSEESVIPFVSPMKKKCSCSEKYLISRIKI